MQVGEEMPDAKTEADAHNLWIPVCAGMTIFAQWGVKPTEI